MTASISEQFVLQLTMPLSLEGATVLGKRPRVEDRISELASDLKKAKRDCDSQLLLAAIRHPDTLAHVFLQQREFLMGLINGTGRALDSYAAGIQEQRLAQEKIRDLIQKTDLLEREYNFPNIFSLLIRSPYLNKDPELLLRYQNAQIKLDNLSGAEDTANTLKSLFPRDPKTLLSQMNLHLHKKNYQEAFVFAKRYYDLNPTGPGAAICFYNQAFSLYKLNKLEDSFQLCQKWRSLFPYFREFESLEKELIEVLDRTPDPTPPLADSDDTPPLSSSTASSLPPEEFLSLSPHDQT